MLVLISWLTFILDWFWSTEILDELLEIIFLSKFSFFQISTSSLNKDDEKKIEIINVDDRVKIENKGQKKIYFIDSKAKKNERWAVNLGCTAGLNLGYNFSLKQKFYDKITVVLPQKTYKLMPKNNNISYIYNIL